MKKITKISAIVLSLIMVAALAFTPSTEAMAKKKKATLKMNKKSVVLQVKKKATLKVTFGGKKVKATKVKWKSSKPKIVSVSKKGVIKGLKEGEKVKIKATYKKKSKTCVVTVQDPNAVKKYTPLKSLSGTVTLSGSTSVQPAAAALAEEFKKYNGYNVKIELTNITGSGAGRTDAKDRKVSFGMVSHEWTDSYVKDFPSLNPIMTALDGVAMVVNTANSQVSNLTFDEIQSIYQGNEKYGLSNPVRRESGSGTLSCFEDALKANTSNKKAPSYSGGQIANSTGQVESVVKGNTKAIGFMSLGSVTSSVKKVKVAGVEATEANILNGLYKMQRPFILLRDKDWSMNKVEQEFMKFVLSREGQAVINNQGFISLPNSMIKNELPKIK